MSADTATPPSDVKWREPGIGLNPQRLCMGCDSKRGTMGGRGMGVRWRCAQCVAKRAQA